MAWDEGFVGTPPLLPRQMVKGLELLLLGLVVSLGDGLLLGLLIFTPGLFAPSFFFLMPGIAAPSSCNAFPNDCMPCLG